MFNMLNYWAKFFGIPLPLPPAPVKDHRSAKGKNPVVIDFNEITIVSIERCYSDYLNAMSTVISYWCKSTAPQILPLHFDTDEAEHLKIIADYKEWIESVSI